MPSATPFGYGDEKCGQVFAGVPGEVQRVRRPAISQEKGTLAQAQQRLPLTGTGWTDVFVSLIDGRLEQAHKVKVGGHICEAYELLKAEQLVRASAELRGETGEEHKETNLELELSEQPWPLGL
jgi:hypothetical protein